MFNEISFQNLSELYIKKRKSSAEIAKIFKCSNHKIDYWLLKYGIPKRKISEAIYIKHNPQGDPFKIYEPKTLEEARLFGLGIGIYWGEGNKADKGTIRVGNSDPELLKIFIRFLMKFFGIKRDDLRFHLHLFSDIDINEATRFWSGKLKIKKQQFYKPMVSISGSLGTYRKKSKYGVLTVYYSNTKLKDIILNKIVEYYNKPL